MVILNECPRDAMQGISQFIATPDKVRYIQALTEVGFDLLDMGSFVSPKWVPQMADTKEVLNQIDLSKTNSRLNVIVANMRGATEAMAFDKISYIGFPFSISPTFQMRNTNISISNAQKIVKDMQRLCNRHNKEFIIYISMAFGNPYGDKWDAEEVSKWVEKLEAAGSRHFVLSDTIGVANPKSIAEVFKLLNGNFPHLEFAAHFHSTSNKWTEKLEAALVYGCHQFDGAIGGLGGCPMAKDDLTGNMPTEKMIAYFEKNKIQHRINLKKLESCVQLAREIFPPAIVADHFRPNRKNKKIKYP